MQSPVIAEVSGKGIGAEFEVGQHPLKGLEIVVSDCEPDKVYIFTDESPMYECFGDGIKSHYLIDRGLLTGEFSHILFESKGKEAQLITDCVYYNGSSFAREPLRGSISNPYLLRYGFTYCNQKAELVHLQLDGSDFWDVERQMVIPSSSIVCLGSTDWQKRWDPLLKPLKTECMSLEDVVSKKRMMSSAASMNSFKEYKSLVADLRCIHDSQGSVPQVANNKKNVSQAVGSRAIYLSPSNSNYSTPHTFEYIPTIFPERRLFNLPPGVLGANYDGKSLELDLYPRSTLSHVAIHRPELVSRNGVLTTSDRLGSIPCLDELPVAGMLNRDEDEVIGSGISSPIDRAGYDDVD